MKRTVTFTEEHFLKLMKDAYEDGFDDGQKSRCMDGPARDATDKDWTDSVAKDIADAAIKGARQGGKP